MHAQCSECILGSINGREWLSHSKIPQTNLSVATTRDQFPQPTALHVDIRYPLFMLTPHFHHGSCRFKTLIEDAHSPVAESSNKNVTRNLVRC